MPRVLPGLDLLCGETVSLIRGSRIGVITNPSGVTSGLVPTVTALESVPGVQVFRLFAPEHGIHAVVDDAKPVPDAQDPAADREIVSLFGDRLAPEVGHLRDLDALVFDVQDVGVRFYTYTTTLLYAMRVAAVAGVRVIVCDRPNPIGGLHIEGPVLDPGLESFLGAGPLPIRHGMTVGEIARFYRDVWGVACDLNVVPCQGWRRGMLWSDTGLMWVPPSPAMPKPETANLYPGTCLFEGVNLSEGRGTALPFEQVGAPWLDADAVVAHLEQRAVPGVRFRATHFKPCSDDWQGEECRGIQFHVTDPHLLRPVSAILQVLQVVAESAAADLVWRLPHFDLLLGNRGDRMALLAGVGVDEIEASWGPGLAGFAEERESVLLYEQ